jgi:hypothetical protein
MVTVTQNARKRIGLPSIKPILKPIAAFFFNPTPSGCFYIWFFLEGLCIALAGDPDFPFEKLSFGRRFLRRLLIHIFCMQTEHPRAWFLITFLKLFLSLFLKSGSPYGARAAR